MISNHEVLPLLIKQHKILLLLLPCDCSLKRDDVETSWIMCNKHYNDFDNIIVITQIGFSDQKIGDKHFGVP